MLKDITFGQYFESNSLIHRTDPRVKIVLMIALIVFIFVSGNMFSLLLSAAFVLLVLIVSRVPFKMYLKNMNAILPGKDYEFGSNQQGDTSANFGTRNE